MRSMTRVARPLLALFAVAPISLACAGREERGAAPSATAAPTDWVLPPVAVPFRWAAQALGCQATFQVRSAADRCALVGGGEVQARVAGDAKPVIEVERTGAVAWRAALPVSTAVTTPVLVPLPDASAVVIVAAGADAVEVAVLELASGAVRARGLAPIAGVTALQLERRHDGDLVRIHARTARGGSTALLDAVTGSLLGVAETPAAAIVSQMLASAQSADGKVETMAGAEPIRAGWDDGELVVRAGDPATPRWRALLSRTSGPYRFEQVTVHVAGDLVVGTIHHPTASWTQVFGVGLADGAVRWRRTITGIGPVAHSAYRNRVASRVEGDLLLIQGVESGGTYVCAVELATGRERACVDSLADGDVVVPPDPVHLMPERAPPPRPLGPQVSLVRCRPGSSTVTRFSGRRESSVNLMASIETPSVTCKPTLSGGIVGDRIELTVHDGGTAAAEPCTCRIVFKQDYDAASQTIIVRDHAGKELVRQPVPGWP